MLVRVDSVAYATRSRVRGTEIEVRVRGVPHRIRIEGSHLFLDGTKHTIRVEDLEERSAAAASGARNEPRGRVSVRPPMPGRLVRLHAVPGMEVRRGQALAILEAMKMQNEIPAPVDAVVKDVLAKEGETVTSDRVIVVLESRSARAR